MDPDAKPGNGNSGAGDTEVVETPTTDRASQFPPTLVSMDPPTLPAADGLAPPHRDTDARGPSDLPQFRPFPEPQRSVPGHPTMRRRLARLFLFWRRRPSR